jgi:hypothetical protein
LPMLKDNRLLWYPSALMGGKEGSTMIENLVIPTWLVSLLMKVAGPILYLWRNILGVIAFLLYAIASITAWGFNQLDGLVQLPSWSKYFQVRQSRRRAFSLFGLEWDITPNFWLNYQYFTSDNLSDSYLDLMIIGPFCPKCEMSMTSDLKNGQCHNCKYEFQPYKC